jgi:hypothetical protein
LSLHSAAAFCVGPNILLSILLSNTNNFCLILAAGCFKLLPCVAVCDALYQTSGK